MIQIQIKNLTRLFLVILGAILFIAFIWYRFIRERLPKNIPFNLTEYGCLILTYICCIYLIIITFLIFRFNSTSNISNFIDYIYKPLKVLDESIKTNPLINIYHKKTIEYFISILNEKNYTYIYYFFNIFPRIILITFLSIDIFWFHHMKYFYKIILVGLLIFIYKYFIYSLKYAKELYTISIECIVEEIMTDHGGDIVNNWTFISVRDFIQIQSESIFYDKHKYLCNPQMHLFYMKKFPPKTPVQEMKKESLSLLNNAISISVHIEEFDLLHSFNKLIKYTKIVIFSTYLICWSYILVISVPFLPVNAFEWLWVIQDMEEPFSLTNIYKSTNQQ
jgi:hypothetical protein